MTKIKEIGYVLVKIINSSLGVFGSGSLKKNGLHSSMMYAHFPLCSLCEPYSRLKVSRVGGIMTKRNSGSRTRNDKDFNP